MYQIFIKNSERTGSPEFWAYEEKGSSCSIAFGSCFKTGHQIQSKPSGYGSKNLSKKIANGYQFICESTLNDVNSAKIAIFGSSSSLSQNAFDIYSNVMKLAGRSVNQSLRPATSTVATTAQVPQAPVQTSPRKPKSVKTDVSTDESFVNLLPGVPFDTANSSWAW